MFNKKMILMLVVLSALVAGMATAGDATWKTYGKLHTSLNMVNDSEDSQLRLTSNTSRFGLKGSYELNDNFTAIWQFEQSLNIAQNGDRTNDRDRLELANRNSFIGVTGEWGTFLAGVHDHPFKVLGRKTTFFKDSIGDNRATMMGWDRRMGDVVGYVSPNFDGFTFFGAYLMDQGVLGADEAMTAFSANAMYNKDGILIGAAIENLSKGFAPMGTGEEMTYGESQMGMRVAGKYTAEKFAVAAIFQSLSDVGGYANVSATTMGAEVMFKMNPKFAFKGGMWMANPYTDAEDDAETEIDESDVNYTLLSIGIDHTFCKNVSYYVQYAMMMNGNYSMQGIGSNGWGTSIGASAAGESPYGLSVGSVVTF